MKALTLWQPWASLMALGVKTIETRIWSTFYRGPIAIHAAAEIPAKWLGSSRYTAEFGDEVAHVLNVKRDLVGPHVNQLPRGAVLCIVELLQITPTVTVDISRCERLFGNYEEGRYAWHTRLVEVFKTPIPAKGNRKLWEWSGR